MDFGFYSAAPGVHNFFTDFEIDFSGLCAVFFNLILFLGALIAVGIHVRHSSVKKTLKYFTVLSNILCGASAAVMVIRRLCGPVYDSTILLKLTGTAAVTVTLLTVLFFLGPAVGYKRLLSGPDLWLHLICPVLAVMSWLLWDKNPSALKSVECHLPFWTVLVGWSPVVIYGCLYLWKVIYAPPEKRWEDSYGFNKGGRWPVSFVAMMAGGFLVSLLLWLPAR